MRLLSSIILFSISLYANATEQIPDVISIDTAPFEIVETPLNRLIDNQEFHKRFSPDMCSGNWRGYKAYWAIHKGKLLLRRVELNACSDNPKGLNISDLTGTKDARPVASWYTGPITIRISARKFFNKKEHGWSGVQYEAVVYNFIKGRLVNREVKTIDKRW